MLANHAIALYCLLCGVVYSMEAVDLQCGSEGCDSSASAMVLLQNRHQIGPKADKYSWALQSTGCPNPSPDASASPFSEYRTQTDDVVWSHMYSTCAKARDLDPSQYGANEKLCCGLVPVCKPACVKQTSWTDMSFRSSAGATKVTAEKVKFEVAETSPHQTTQHKVDSSTEQPTRQKIESVLDQEAEAVRNSTVPSLQKTLLVQLEYELNLSQEPPSKNKLILAFIEILGLGVFGIDRCYMGQTMLGILKGVTFGGFVVWAAVDFVILGYYLLIKSTSVDCFGYHAKFDQGLVEPAFWVFLILLAIMICGAGGHASTKPKE